MYSSYRNVSVALLLAGLCVVSFIMWHNTARAKAASYAQNSLSFGSRTASNSNAAISKVRSALSRDPRNADLHEQLGILLSRSNKARAISEVRIAIRLAPQQASYHASLGYLLAEAGKPEEALSCFRFAVDMLHRRNGSTGKEWLPIYGAEVARIYDTLGRDEDAEAWYERSLAWMFAYRTDWLASGMDRRNKRNSFGKAFEADMSERLATIRDRNSRHRPSREWVSKRLPMLRFPDRARGACENSKDAGKLETSLRSGKASGTALNIELGMDYLACGHVNEAVIQFLAAIEQDASNNIAWDELGWSYLIQGRLLKAAAAFSEADHLGSSGSGQLATMIRNQAKAFENGAHK